MGSTGFYRDVIVKRKILFDVKTKRIQGLPVVLI
jgi:hypothetical protein